MFALVAVDQEGVVALVHHQGQDLVDGGGRGEGVGAFVGEHGDVVVGDAVGGHEGEVGGGDGFGDEG